MATSKIQFNRPYMTGREFEYIIEAKMENMLAGDGPFTKRCQKFIELFSGAGKCLLTHSCTGALEMAALLLKVQPGDEIIMPSYTFVSTANAFVLRGGIPVFVDIREDTLNLDERLIESAITPRTTAIVPVHYAGVGCNMDAIMKIANHHGLKVVEDAAQAVFSKYKGRHLGTIGSLGAYSFHETKNVISGEGGSLLINDATFDERAEIIREKGTNRSLFFRGQIDKYTWQDLGSSFLPGELIAAFLLAQLEAGEEITAKRLKIWQHYHEALASLEAKGLIRRPIIPSECEHNGHMYYILLSPQFDRRSVLTSMNEEQIYPVFHYTPLHSSPAGQFYGRVNDALSVTEHQSERLIRLPLWVGMNSEQQELVVLALQKALSGGAKRNSFFE